MQVLLLPAYEYINGFWMAYLHSILTDSKGQSQGHANIVCEYLVNGDR